MWSNYLHVEGCGKRSLWVYKADNRMRKTASVLALGRAVPLSILYLKRLCLPSALCAWAASIAGRERKLRNVTDEPAPDPMPSDSPGLLGDTASEDELDTLLSQAASLSDEVVGQVGTSADQQASADTDDDPVPDVDAELAELEDLLSKTGAEIGREPLNISELALPDVGTETLTENEVDTPSVEPTTAADSASEPAQPEGNTESSEKANSAPAPPDVDLDVPDFMSEFTEPAPEPKTVAPTDHIEAGSTSTATASANLGPDVSSLEKKAAPTAVPAHVAVLAGREPAANFDATKPEAIPPDGTDNSKVGVRRRVATKITPLALPICDRAVRLLEALNRPTQRIGYAPRILIGWLAIATIGTSLIVFLISMF